MIFIHHKDLTLKKENIEYERKLHTSHATRGENIRKVRQLKEKMQESDPFFMKRYDTSNEKFIKERENNLSSNKPNYYDSDIFNQKEFDLSKDKSVDKHIFADTRRKIYGTFYPSNSEWSPKNSKINLMNHGSVPFSIFNPNMKSFVKTKDEISQDHNGSPANKQKALCEFIDLARVFAPNPNKEWLNSFQKSDQAFHKNSNICANYQNLHRMYGSLCDKPFVKKIN